MYPADISALPSKELDRLRLIEHWQSGVITQVEAARALGISERQLRRLIRRYEAQGATGLRASPRSHPRRHQDTQLEPYSGVFL